MNNERIKLEDSAIEMVTKMSEGNPGAAIALMEIMKKEPLIDPDSALGPFGSMITLDSIGIYGSDIYVLHNDICYRNVAHTIAVLRAVQLGLFNRQTLKNACSKQDRSGRDLVPVSELYDKVKAELPLFNSVEIPS